MLQRCLGRFLQPVDFLEEYSEHDLASGLEYASGNVQPAESGGKRSYDGCGSDPCFNRLPDRQKTLDRGRCHNGHEDVARNFICGGNYDTGQGIVLFMG